MIIHTVGRFLESRAAEVGAKLSGTLDERLAQLSALIEADQAKRQKIRDEQNALEGRAKGGDEKARQRYNALVDEDLEMREWSHALQTHHAALLRELGDMWQVARLNGRW